MLPASIGNASPALQLVHTDSRSSLHGKSRGLPGVPYELDQVGGVDDDDWDFRFNVPALDSLSHVK